MLIVIVAVWALATAIKSLLALWALGSCNVTKPSACSLGAEVCSIDEAEPSNIIEATGRWFTEWGEIFEAIPDKFRSYNAEDYEFSYITVDGEGEERPVAVDIFDPGCSVCARSYINQKQAGFFDQYDVRLVPFAIQDADDSYKFKNSEIIVRYMFAAEQIKSGVAVKILDHIFTEKNEEGISYQTLFNEDYSREDAVKKLEEWLKGAGFDKKGIAEIREIADYPETTDKMKNNREIVENQINVRGIPTMLYNGAKHTGLWKAE